MEENLPTERKHSSYLYLNRVQMSFLAFLKCVPKQTTDVLFSFLLLKITHPDSQTLLSYRVCPNHCPEHTQAKNALTVHLERKFN